MLTIDLCVLHVKQVLTDIMPKATRDKWASKGVNTTVEQIVDGVNDSEL